MKFPRVMRGTVKQSGPPGGTAKEDLNKPVTGGGRRTKANNNNNSGDQTLPGVSMIIKQEAKVEVKPDPDAATSPILNGEDSLKVNLNSVKLETKVKVEMVNGGLLDSDVKPTISESLLSLTPTTTTNTSSSSSPPGITSPHNADGDSSKDGVGVSKGCGAGVATSEAQYMQQQSQIFVFTTRLANEAAEAVIKGHFTNIIAYHCAQPMTKQLLEKHPLKTNQFVRANQAQWLNNSCVKNSTKISKPEINTPSCMQGNPPMIMPAGMGGGPPSAGASPMNVGGGPHNMNIVRPNPGMPPQGMMGPRGPMMMHPGNGGPMMGPGVMSMMDSMPMESKVPDSSDLTPDQRMHREEQMARLRQMQAVIFPDLHPESQNEMGGPGCESSIPPHPCSMTSGTKSTQCQGPPPCGAMTPSNNNNSSVMISSSSCTGSSSMQNYCLGANNIPSSSCSGTVPPRPSCGGPYPPNNPQQIQSLSGQPNQGRCSIPPLSESGPPTPISCPNTPSSSAPSSTCSVPSCSSSITTTTVSTSSSNSGSSQTNTSSTPTHSTTGAPPSCSQMTSSNMGPSPIPRMGPSPIPRMGPSPSMGQSPNMGSSPGMGPSPGAMGPMGGQMGHNMNMPPNMMVMGGGPMNSQPNMMMGPNQGMMGGNNMMMNPQNGMMGGMRMMGPGGSMMMGGPSQSMAVAHMDWQRMQSEFFESKRKKGPMCPDMGMMGGMGPMHGNPMMVGPMGPNMMMGPMRPMGPNNGTRMQGPPPPYHGPRPMGNEPLPSPGSPSMCPIPSPRLSNCSNPMRMPNSGVDSPRPMGYSNPTTPGSVGPVPSPSLSMKDQNVGQQSLPNEPMPFGRQLQSFAQQKQQQGSQVLNGGNKEPSLMPVPSPQQIQYLNTFDGQELTIQKQPNTSLRDNDILSPINSGIDSIGGRNSGPATPQGGPTTPSDRFTGPNTPDRFPVPSPGMVPPSTPQDPKTQQRFVGGPSPQGPTSSNSSNKNPSLDSRFPSPKTPGDMNNGSSRFPGASPIPVAGSNGTKMAAGGGAFSTSPKKGAATMEMGEFNNAANLPLNPNCSTPTSIQSVAPGKVFDPISSMAQMSQQLTSGQAGTSSPISSATTPTLPGVPMGGVPMGPGMIGSPGCMMGMPPVPISPGLMSGPIPSPGSIGGGPRCSSPASMMNGPNPRMVCVRPNNPNMAAGPGAFGGTNVQVLPGAPNTIEYLPARAPCNSMSGPRGPPSLEFLPRFNNPGQIEKSGSPMFPNNSTPNTMCAPNVPMSSMSMSGACGPGPGPMNMPGGPMCTMSGPNGPVGANNMNSPYPGPNGPMGMGPNGPIGGMAGPMGPNCQMMGPNNPMGGPMMGPNGPMGMNPSMMMGGPMGPNGQMMGTRGGGPMMRGPSPAMMNSMPSEMYSMNSSNPNMPTGPMPSGPNAMMGASGPMYCPKGSPVNMGMSVPMGAAPDAAQPLPPSMGQSGNFKNNTIIGPTTVDPTYAAQFHNFQQQLYATNTRGPMGPMGGHLMPPHGGPVGGGGVPMVPQNFPYNAK